MRTAALLLWAVACAAPVTRVRAYPGGPRPEVDIAIVRAARHGTFDATALNVMAVRVDGTPVSFGRGAWRAPPDIELEPGRHTLTLELDGEGRSLTAPLATFRAEAGHVYELRGERVPGSFEFDMMGGKFSWRWSIVDTAAGSVVAESGPSPEAKR